MKATALLLSSLLVATSAAAAGLEAPPQNAKAAAMGGAFVAQADDASAIYYNPGGLALLKKKKGVAAGLTMSENHQALFQGLPPGIATGTTAQQPKNRQTVPHAFLALPFGARGTFGVGTYSPLREQTDWNDPATYPGRFLATSSRITSYDVAPTYSFGAGPVGIGASFIYRNSTIEASRRVGAQLAGTTRDIGTLTMKTDSTNAYGWRAGILIRPSDRFAAGLTYHSRISTDYVGVGKLTQNLTGNAQFDALIAASFPFGDDVQLATTLTTPAQLSAGIAIGLAKPLLLEVDVDRMQWRRVQGVTWTFGAQHVLDTAYALRLHDTTNIRAGLRLQFPTGPQIRIGYALVKSPQPDETVGAFLADADRSTITAGVGLDWLHVALSYTTFKQRIVTTNLDALNGNYRGDEYAVTLSVVK
jgi:long-chain fatty acid transport protein